MLLSVDAATEPKVLALEVWFDSDPIEGRVYEGNGGDGVDRRFSGWLGLMAAIDAARSTGKDGTE